MTYIIAEIGINHNGTIDLAKDIIQKESNKQYDLIFIVGKHSKDGVLNDHKIYIPILKEGGFMVFDDYVTINPGKNCC